jgi:hypothetical protein
VEEKKAVLKEKKSFREELGIILAAISITDILCGILYRMGGSGNWPRQARVIGVPLLSIGLLWFLGGWNWWLLLCIPLMIAAISTYWKRKGEDAHFINYLFHGLGIAVAMLPYSIATHHYIGFGIRGLLLPVLVASWATKMNRPILWWRADVVSEFGRGFLIAATMPILLL